jgi:hypothetical protein
VTIPCRVAEVVIPSRPGAPRVLLELDNGSSIELEVSLIEAHDFRYLVGREVLVRCETPSKDAEWHRARERDAQRRMQAKASGICSACCKRPAAPGYKSCALCLEKRGRGPWKARRAR